MLLNEVAARLVTAGVGVIGTSIFMGSKAVIPAGDGPYLTLSQTGGTAPTRVQNQAAAATQRPTFQVAVRAQAYQDALTMASAAYAALDGVFNSVLSGTNYLSMTARQEPTDLGLDDAGRVLLVFNLEVEKTVS